MYLLLRYLYNWWPAKRFFFSNKSWGCNQDWLQLIMQWQTKKKITYWWWWLKCSLECNWNLYVCKFSILIEYIHMYIIFQMISKKLALTFKWWIDEFFNRFHFFHSSPLFTTLQIRFLYERFIRNVFNHCK